MASSQSPDFVETSISTNQGLQNLDKQLNQAYSGLMKNAFNPILLRAEQRYWLGKRRSACKDVTCIQSAYVSRLKRLDCWHQYTLVAGTTFEHLGFYEDAPPTDLLTDKFIGALLKSLVGKYFPTLENNLSTSDGAKFTSNAGLIADGCAAHACVVAEARIVIQKSGEIYVVIWDSEHARYFTNDKSKSNDPPQAIYEFLAHLGNPKIEFTKL